MADVQAEHGHIRIANALWDAVAAADLTHVQRRCLDAVIRQSWGFGRRTTAGWLSLSFVQKYSRMKRSDCSRGLKQLRQKGVVRRVRQGDATNASEYAVVKDFDRWGDGVLPDGWAPLGVVPERGLVPDSSLVPERAPGVVPEQGPHKNQGNNQEPPKAPQGASPKKHQKAAPPERSPEELQVFDLWKRLQADSGTTRRVKAFPSDWGVSARIDEYGVEAVVDVVEWAHRSSDKRAQQLREGGYLAKTLFRPSKFAEYEGLAGKWRTGSKDAWLKEWRGAFSAFVSDVGRKTRRGGRESFLEWLRTHDSRAFPVPDEVLEAVDRRTGEAA